MFKLSWAIVKRDFEDMIDKEMFDDIELAELQDKIKKEAQKDDDEQIFRLLDLAKKFLEEAAAFKGGS